MKYLRNSVICCVVLLTGLAVTWLAGIPDLAEAEASESSSVLSQPQLIQELRQRVSFLFWRVEGLAVSDQLQAEGFLVAELQDAGEPAVYLSQNRHHSYSIASVTKLMSAVVAREHLDQDQVITLNEEMLAPYGYSPALYLGSKVRVADLLKASLIQSTNDAAESLARSLPAGQFVELMNAKAEQLGMDGTVYYDAHGLNPDNRSRLDDILTLMNYISDRHPEIWEITRTEGFQLPDPSGRLLTFKNLNLFHGLDNHFLGGKTGYLPEAKQTYASLFQVNGREFAVILLRSDDRRSDIDNIHSWLIRVPDSQ